MTDESAINTVHCRVCQSLCRWNVHSNGYRKILELQQDELRHFNHINHSGNQIRCGAPQ